MYGLNLVLGSRGNKVWYESMCTTCFDLILMGDLQGTSFSIYLPKNDFDDFQVETCQDSF